MGFSEEEKAEVAEMIAAGIDHSVNPTFVGAASVPECIDLPGDLQWRGTNALYYSPSTKRQFRKNGIGGIYEVTPAGG